ncbi:MAG: ABC transporter permease [Caulobacteraceae bacterium]|nr:ABC transporter permease [Caulobacteraceae bacterium]
MPQFAIPTIIVAPAFYALFSLGLSGQVTATATQLLATFGVYAVMGPALFGFGAAVANERQSGQLELKRLSPMPAGAQIFAKLMATTTFSAAALAMIYLIADFAGVVLDPARWIGVAAVHLCGVIPFALIGLSIGYRMGAKGAVAMVNAIFLAMSVMGGLWIPLDQLPHPMQSVAWVLPSFHLGEIALMAAGVRELGTLWVHLAFLAPMTAASFALAWAGQRRQSS